MQVRAILGAALLAASTASQAYCIHNELPDRGVFVEQEPHKEKLREDRILRRTIAPGTRYCCRNLDCNPGGRDESIVNLEITIRGDPEYYCVAEGDEYVKVTGDGIIRVMPNPRKSVNPYVVRVRTGRGKDLTGPRGVPCSADLTVKGRKK